MNLCPADCPLPSYSYWIFPLLEASDRDSNIGRQCKGMLCILSVIEYKEANRSNWGVTGMGVGLDGHWLLSEGNEPLRAICPNRGGSFTLAFLSRKRVLFACAHSHALHLTRHRISKSREKNSICCPEYSSYA